MTLASSTLLILLSSLNFLTDTLAVVSNGLCVENNYTFTHINFRGADHRQRAKAPIIAFIVSQVLIRLLDTLRQRSNA